MMSETTENTGGTSAAEKEISADDVKRFMHQIRKAEDERDSALERARAAERERDDASSRVVSAAEQEWNARVSALDAELATTQSEAERAENDYVAAREAADARAEARANRLLNQADRKAEQIAQQKKWMEANKARLIAEAAPRQQQRGKYDGVLDEKALVGGERDWLDARPRVLTDAKYRSMVFGASSVAEGRGYKRGSPEYLREIEKLIGEGSEDPVETRGNGHDEQYDEQEPAPPPAPPRRNLSSDLAPQRHAPGRPPSNAGEVPRLNPNEQEMADMMYGNRQSPDFIEDRTARFKKYWQNKKLMEAKGRYDR